MHRVVPEVKAMSSPRSWVSSPRVAVWKAAVSARRPVSTQAITAATGAPADGGSAGSARVLDGTGDDSAALDEVVVAVVSSGWPVMVCEQPADRATTATRTTRRMRQG